MSENTHIDMYAKPLLDMSSDLQEIFEHFNWRLFQQRLPSCMISLKCQNGSYGYYRIGGYARKDGKLSDEIILNPTIYAPQNPRVFLAAFVHQMVHIDQTHFGEPGRTGYHNRQWADKMIKIGLQPTNTGHQGGRETGDRVFQTVIPDGAFEHAARELAHRNGLLTWKQHINVAADNNRPDIQGITTNTKSGKRVKYCCPMFDECRQSAYSKHDAHLKCGHHNLRLMPFVSKKRGSCCSPSCYCDMSLG